MAKMEKHYIGEVNEIYERYCFNKRDKKGNLEFRLRTDSRERKFRASFVSMNTLLRERSVLRGAKYVSGARKRIILRKGAKMPPRLTPLRATKTWKKSVL